MSDSTPPSSYTFAVPTYPQVLSAALTERRPYWLHILLLLLTTLSTLVVGAQLHYNFIHDLPAFDSDTFAYSFLHPGSIIRNPHYLLTGIPFCVTLMGILLAHEFGHFLLCERYQVYATLPYFLPGPIISPIGTFGAVIRIKSPIRSRKALFDIGIAGPIGGFLVALPVLFWGLALSRPVADGSVSSAIDFGYPPIFYIVHRLLAPVVHHPAPLAALYLHPVAIAAWVGMLATALNLLPGGQFDGGHIIYAVAPRAHKWITRATIAVLIPMGILFWPGWLLWAVILAFTGAKHPNVPKWPDIGKTRVWLSLLALLMLVLTLALAPVRGYGILSR
jgi:membrane-associated protease RseP (regulator of RpoE activity)